MRTSHNVLHCNTHNDGVTRGMHNMVIDKDSGWVQANVSGYSIVLDLEISTMRT